MMHMYVRKTINKHILMYTKNMLQLSCSKLFRWLTYRGILPDYMHIVHLALGVDALGSVLMDLVDHPDGLIAGSSRENKLGTLWDNYKEWADATRAWDQTQVVFFGFMQQNRERFGIKGGPTCSTNSANISLYIYIHMFIYVYRCACINAKFWTRNSVEKLPMYDIASQKPYLDRESLFFASQVFLTEQPAVSSLWLFCGLLVEMLMSPFRKRFCRQQPVVIWFCGAARCSCKSNAMMSRFCAWPAIIAESIQ